MTIKRNIMYGQADEVPADIEIHQVTYALLKNIGNYENERIEFTAKVYSGQNPQDVAKALKEKAIDTLAVLAKVKIKR